MKNKIESDKIKYFFSYSQVLLLMFIGVAVVVLLAACSKENKKEEGEGEENSEENHSNTVEVSKQQFDAIGIGLGSIEKRDLRNIVKASGYLEVPPQNKANVSSYIGAVIAKIFVLEGQFVKKGQTLATLEHPDFIKLQEKYIEMNNTFAYMEKEYLRQKELFENNAIAGKVFQKAESDYNTQKAVLSSTALQLKLLNVNPDALSSGNIIRTFSLVAPIKGYIGKISAYTGMYAEPAMPLFEIVDNRQIHCDLYVYERDLFKVRIGQKVNFVLTNIAEHQQLHDNKTIQGEIFGINKSFENESKALALHAKIKNESHELIEGMFVNASIDVGSFYSTVVPREAIVTTDGKEYVFIAEQANNTNSENSERSYHFRLAEVVTGVSDLGYTEIKPLDSISDNAQIVIKGAFFLLSKIKSQESGDEH